MINIKNQRQKTISIFLCLFIISISTFVFAQDNFADKCIGKWGGIMYIYGKGQLKDSVSVELDVQKLVDLDIWTWKTSYLSKTMPMVKDYKLKLIDKLSQTYSTDENNGIELMDYYFNNKLYSVFERHGVMLTSSYDLNGDQLIFEVSSGKK